MSRVGKLPVAIPSGVTVNVADSHVAVKGGKGELKTRFNQEVTVEVKDGKVFVQPRNKGDESAFVRAIAAHFTRNVFRHAVESVLEALQTGSAYSPDRPQDSRDGHPRRGQSRWDRCI